MDQMKTALYLFTLSLFVASIGIAHAVEKRVALVIGNGAYKSSPLKNPVNDATDIAGVLDDLGFQVILQTDANRRTMHKAMQQFREKLRGTQSMGLFYYAGHGAQYNGRNYLLPIGHNITSASDLPIDALDAQGVLAQMQEAGNPVNVVILDACRDQPFPGSTRSGTRGLARIDAITGSLVAYATKPGGVAEDGAGRNGVYTSALLRQMREPGLSLTDLFNRVGLEVSRATAGKQEPWVSLSPLPTIYLAGESGGSGLSPSPGLVSLEGEIVFWQSISGSKDCSDYEAYLASYPDGRFANLARVRGSRYCVEANQEIPEVEVAGGMDVQDVLDECTAHLKANRLTTGKGGNALDCYTEALQIEPGNVKALGGITAIEDKYIGWVKREIRRSNVPRAERFLVSLKTVNSDRAEAEELEDAIAGLKQAVVKEAERKAEEQIELEPEEKNDFPISIAIVPFEWRGANSPPQKLADLVEADLVRSGRFESTPRNDFLEAPHDNAEVKYKNWRMLKTEALVVGKLRALTPGKYEAQFRLLDVYKEKQLAGYRFVVDGSKMRKVAHQISDIIYEALTGNPGAFDTRIAYVTVQKPASRGSRTVLMVADSDGYGPREIISSKHLIMSPAWSPDGTRLAYVSFEDGRPMVFLQDLASGKRRKLASFPGVNAAPAWSPGGDKLAMTLSRDGNPEIYVMRMSDARLTRLTNHHAIDTEPAWSPDGESLVFTSDRAGKPQIYRIPATGGSAKRLTFEGKYNARASFNPDGNQLVLVTNQGRGYQIGVFSLDRRILQVLADSRRDSSPTFAPNGDMILYESQVGVRGVLAVVSTDNQVTHRLEIPGDAVSEPAWSPFYSRQ